MTVETGNTISNLKPGWPLKSDPKSQGDDHIRVIKRILQTQFPDGVDGDGFKIPITATSRQINWLSEVNSDIQTQLDNLSDAIGESGLSGAITYNSQRIVINTAAIGNTSSGLTKAVNTNTAAIGNTSSGLTKAVNANTEALVEIDEIDLLSLETQVGYNTGDIATLNSGPHLHIAGVFSGADLTVHAGTGFTIARASLVPGDDGYPGIHPAGYYTVTMTPNPPVGNYVVNVTAGAITAGSTISSSQFAIYCTSTDGVLIDPTQVHFMVVDV